jgi:hypothetical protein
MTHCLQKNFKLNFARLFSDMLINGAAFCDNVASLNYDIAKKRINVGVYDDAEGGVISMLAAVTPDDNRPSRLMRPNLVVSPELGDGYTLIFEGVALKAHSIDRGNKAEIGLAILGIDQEAVAAAHAVTFSYTSLKVITPKPQPSSESAPN